MDSNILPVEIWHLIFSFACIDDGSTVRSLSLVSTHFREMSAPFKYRSIAISHWSQIIAFSQFFCKLPASQKKTVALFVHHPYPFLDVDGYPSPSMGMDRTSDDFENSEGSEDIQEIRDGSALPECNDGDDVNEALGEGSQFEGDGDLEGGSDDGSWNNSDNTSDSEFEGSFDSEEEREILKDVEYLEAVRDRRLTFDGNTRDDNLRDAEIQAFFDKVLQAFHAILNEISSTLQLLVVYWNSFKPLQLHKLLPALPCLVELHINRSSITRYDYEDPPTTALFPQLKSLYISGDNPRKLRFRDELARVAPNLNCLRLSMPRYYNEPDDSEGPKGPEHDFYFHKGRTNIESDDHLVDKYEDSGKKLEREFGEFKFYLVDVYKSNSPTFWQIWRENRMAGNNNGFRIVDDEPWNFPKKESVKLFTALARNLFFM